MTTIRTTTYEHDVAGQLVAEKVVTEEIPNGAFLRIDGLTEEQVATLVTVRNAFEATA